MPIKERENILKDLYKKNLLSPDIMEHSLEEIKQEFRTLAQLKEDYLRNSQRGITYLEAARELYLYCSKATMHTIYDEEIFKRFVNEVFIFSREEIGSD